MSGSIASRNTKGAKGEASMNTGEHRHYGPDRDYIEKHRQDGIVKKAFAEPEPTSSKKQKKHAVGTKAAFFHDGILD